MVLVYNIIVLYNCGVNRIFYPNGETSVIKLTVFYIYIFYIVFRDEKDDDVDNDDDDRRSVNEVVITTTERRRSETAGEIAVRCGAASDDGQPMFESDKEKECWALFKKMTAKGVSITFDTVLRFVDNINNYYI